MVLSRCPYPPGRERATLSRCLISSEVRYSRGRTAALVGRRSVIVRFSVVGPLLRFIRNPLFFIGEVYPIVRISVKNGWLLSGFGVVMIGRRDQGADEGAQERLPAAPGVVDELEEAEIGGQLLLRDAPVGP